MALKTVNFIGDALELFTAAQDAITQIPPAFPLAATVAVNPYLGQTGLERAQTAALLERAGGLRITPPRAELAKKLAAGEISETALNNAAKAAGLSVADLRSALTRTDAPAAQALPRVADLAQAHSGIDWPEFVADRFGLWAAARYDEGQALWPAPQGEAYQSWRAFAARDLTPEVSGLSGFVARINDLPADARSALVDACATLGVTVQAAPLYFHRLLLAQEGWSQFARGKGWLAERDGGRDKTAFGFLTIALQWEAGLLAHYGDVIKDAWADALDAYATPVEPSLDHRIDAALADALDRSAEERLAAQFDEPLTAAATQRRPSVQAAFCIDVRSEVFRRALESVDATIDTLGFAGFFGLAITHRGEASVLDEARAPVLLNPGLNTTATLPTPADEAKRIALRTTRAWGRFKQAAVSAFAFVEAAGPAYVGKLVNSALPRAQGWAHDSAPSVELPLEQRVATAKTVLSAMSLTSNFARLVVIAGHGAKVTNAPHASALQCGACGGHAGDVNARLLAGLLNDPEVRAGLPTMGVTIPADTVFVGAVHDTTADTLTLYDTDQHASHASDIARFNGTVAQAGLIARTERARRLPRGSATTLPKRGGDWSELRPEWGLAGCEAFIAAPRAGSRGRDLGGWAFLHDYNWKADDGFGVLELILTAPVVVASWISLQYHGSTLAPEAFGGGNKLVHNVTGGIGVVEGNGGLLRAGLPWQSVHDGQQAQHGSLRLKVVLAAPTEAVDAILTKHPGVRDLFDNGWLSLHHMDDAGRITARYERGNWTQTATAKAHAA